jgi:hypothetical protein
VGRSGYGPAGFAVAVRTVMGSLRVVSGHLFFAVCCLESLTEYLSAAEGNGFYFSSFMPHWVALQRRWQDMKLVRAYLE